LTLVRQSLLLRLQTKLSVVMVSRFLWHVMALPVEFFTQRHAGDIATRVGANEQIVEHGRDGLLASTSAEWADALRALRDRSLRARMGAAGRAKVEREYSVQVTAPRLASLLRAAAQPCTT